LKTISSILFFMLVLTAQAAWPHAGNNSSTVVHACILNNTKFVRIIGVNDYCKSYEIATHWNTQGAKGDRGLQGIQGAVGRQGVQGTAGIQGVQGLKGDRGDAGVQGIAGVNGVDGRQGVQGTAGIQGVQGLKGDRGDAGVQGIAGLNGVDGRQGAQGTAGIQGIQGLKGDNGLKGNDGKSAYQLALDSGYVGELAGWLGSFNGTDGVNGNDGSQGIAGINGIQGPKGDTGTQGLQGIQGEKGDVGVIEPGACIQDDLTGRWVVFATQGNNDVRFTIDIDAKGTLTGTNLYTDSKIPKDGELAGDVMMSDNKEIECFFKMSITKVGDQSVSILMEGVISPDHHSIIGGGIRDSFNEPSSLTNLRAIRVSPRA
jgi:Collagen triple helix repeat (20 copies)